jgi:hypothetical protein
MNQIQKRMQNFRLALFSAPLFALELQYSPLTLPLGSPCFSPAARQICLTSMGIQHVIRIGTASQANDTDGNGDECCHGVPSTFPPLLPLKIDLFDCHLGIRLVHLNVCFHQKWTNQNQSIVNLASVLSCHFYLKNVCFHETQLTKTGFRSDFSTAPWHPSFPLNRMLSPNLN